MITVYVPSGEVGYFEESSLARSDTDTHKKGDLIVTKYSPKPYNGRIVVEIPLLFFTRVILAGPQGLKWHNENFEAMRWIGENGTEQQNGIAFPGADRPPLVVESTNITGPIQIRLVAPNGVTNFSHEGQSHKVGDDGTVTVDDALADVLRSHGFKDAA